jgi:hypothetical protein
MKKRKSVLRKSLKGSSATKVQPIKQATDKEDGLNQQSAPKHQSTVKCDQIFYE